ncbi:MAG: hypothetical protein RL385_4752 [Pseudomonadota bacterium]|jgi:electron transport complex protein RnfA
MSDLVWIFASACVVNNFTLSYFLGLCSFFGVTQQLTTALKLGLANTFVLVITSLSAWVLNTFVLERVPYLRLIAFIVVIASTVQFVELVVRRVSPVLFQALGIYLPLISTNCAILGLALFQTSREYGLLQGLAYALGAGAGLTLALSIMAGLREHCAEQSVPRVMRGAALSFVIAGILSLAFMGFAGLFSAES